MGYQEYNFKPCPFPVSQWNRCQDLHKDLFVNSFLSARLKYHISAHLIRSTSFFCIHVMFFCGRKSADFIQYLYLKKKKLHVSFVSDCFFVLWQKYLENTLPLIAIWLVAWLEVKVTTPVPSEKFRNFQLGELGVAAQKCGVVVCVHVGFLN